MRTGTVEPLYSPRTLDHPTVGGVGGSLYSSENYGNGATKRVEQTLDVDLTGHDEIWVSLLLAMVNRPSATASADVTISVRQNHWQNPVNHAVGKVWNDTTGFKYPGTLITGAEFTADVERPVHIVGFLATPLALLIAAHNRAVPPSPLHGWIIFSVLAYLGLWAAGWAWMAHDSIIGLRERVRQGWSLIDVQLKRRHDLLPALSATVAALSAHEREVQTLVADLRAQSQATRPGTAGPEFDGLAPKLRVVVEKYPELKAHEGFTALQRELVTTEQRIALARAYYNDIATHYATRLEIIPDRWIASLRKLTPEPLLAATHFERANVEVKLAA